MYRGSNPRIVPIIVTIIIVAVIIAAIVALGRVLFSGNNSPSTSTTTSLSTSVIDTTANRSVKWTVRGPIVAEENFRSYQITISPESREYTVYSGYLGSVISTQDYPNNTRAYEEFVHALVNADITNTRSSSNDDLRGVCATGGIAYKFETLDGDKADQSIWSSSCNQSKGTMGADALRIQALFANQIPDFKPLFTSVY
ncbi:MAG: hypothetical protein ABIP74_00830 [Candidatus Saccharimonas sp.]